MSREQLYLPADPYAPAQSVILQNPTVIAQPDPIFAKACAAWLAGLVDLDPFRLTLTWNPLGVSAVGSEQKTPVDQGIDFLLFGMNLTAYTAAGTILANPDYLLEMFDGAGPWQDGAHHVQLWTGEHRNSGAHPAMAPMCRFIRGSNNVRGKLTNNTATAARVDLGLEGIRVTYTTGTRESVFTRGETQLR